MQLFTFSDLKTKLQNDYDMQDENFVNDTELVGYINEAIDDSETAIHNLHHEDKYFLTFDTLAMVGGQSAYSLPTDIYGNKLRLIYYVNGVNKYKVNRIKQLYEVPFIEPSDDYRYIITNTTADGVKMALYPPTKTGDDATSPITRWYIRNMIRMSTSLVDAANICEVPECVNFVYQHVRHSLAKKSRNPGLIEIEYRSLQTQYNLMMETLKEMVADENNLIPQDLTHYWDSDPDYWNGGL